MYTCSPVDSVVHCSIGNPLPAGHGALLSIRLDTRNTKASVKPVHIIVQANTSVTSQIFRCCFVTVAIQVMFCNYIFGSLYTAIKALLLILMLIQS